MDLPGLNLLAQVGLSFSPDAGFVILILFFPLCLLACFVAPVLAIFHAVLFVLFRTPEPVRLARWILWASLPLAITAAIIGIGWSTATDHTRRVELTVFTGILAVNAAAITWIALSTRPARAARHPH